MITMINSFLRNLFNFIPSYFSHGLVCPDTLVGDYNKVYIYKVGGVKKNWQNNNTQ